MLNVKEFLVVVTFAYCMVANYAFADALTKRSSPQEKNFGIGPTLSSVSGIGIFARVDRSDFVNIAVGVGHENSYDVSVDYDVGYPDAFDSDGMVVPYWGIGINTVHDGADDYDRVDDGDTAIGMRIPLGINISIGRTPLMASAEVVPSVLVAPVTHSYVKGALGLKVMF